jgi:hypothetical protein
MVTLPPIEATQPCFKCRRTGPLVVDCFAQVPHRWDDPERFMHQYGLCPQPPSTSAPTAESLPVDSVIGFMSDSSGTNRHEIAIKRANREEAWESTDGYGGRCNAFTDEAVTDLLQSGEATVLRVGTGS